LSPGAGARAAFESPKVAAHGDFACTAAMQLAKPLKLNPRQVAEHLRTALLATPAYQRWVSRHRHRRPRLHQHPAQAGGQAAGGARGAGRRRTRFGGVSPPTAAHVLVEFVSANPTGPLHVGHGRQAALGDAICNLYATQGWDVHREFYYNDAGVQIATLATAPSCAPRASSPATTAGPPTRPEAAYNGDYIADIANDFLAGKNGQGRRPRVHRQRRRETWTTSASSPWPTCATSRTWTCRPST
jgi:arginyl-tRNA synthetase